MIEIPVPIHIIRKQWRKDANGAFKCELNIVPPIEHWLKENNISIDSRHFHYDGATDYPYDVKHILIFKSDEDALLFKLRWL